MNPRYFPAMALASLMSLAMHAENIKITAGALQDNLASLKASENALAISGEADARDIAAFRSLPSGVTCLDISNLEIKQFADSKARYFNRTFFESDVLPDYCFFKVPLLDVRLPLSLKEIGSAVFAGSEINSITIPSSVTSIGNYAFYDCKNLSEVALPARLSTIGKGAFGNCPSIKVIDLSETAVTEIPDGCFAGCSALEKVILPPNIKKIGREAFLGTAIRSIDLSDVKELAPYALSGMYSLKDVALNPSAKIGEGALMDNVSLQNLKGTPDYVPALFAANCSSLDLTGSINGSSSVGPYAFANNQAQSLILSANLSFIDKAAFAGNDSLTSIDAMELGDNVPDVAEDAFKGIECSSITLFVKGNPQVWKDHPQWGEFNVSANESTAADSVLSDDQILAKVVNGYLLVSASESITDLAVYSVDGRLIYQFSPDSPSASLSVENVGESVIIAVISTPHNNKTVKILL
ncbi:MAG: leucine-rich repeat domain-containing protein [Muribaculum sp.]|nr:leucine-rich repeat domain-containing protein [Muribaculum sp.]